MIELEEITFKTSGSTVPRACLVRIALFTQDPVSGQVEDNDNRAEELADWLFNNLTVAASKKLANDLMAHCRKIDMLKS